MQKHTKIYMEHFGYGEQDIILCEFCGARANDVHHINGRLGDADNINNLMALCRSCHEKAHAVKITRSERIFVHNQKLYP